MKLDRFSTPSGTTMDTATPCTDRKSEAIESRTEIQSEWREFSSDGSTLTRDYSMQRSCTFGELSVRVMNSCFEVKTEECSKINFSRCIFCEHR